MVFFSLYVNVYFLGYGLQSVILIFCLSHALEVIATIKYFCEVTLVYLDYLTYKRCRTSQNTNMTLVNEYVTFRIQLLVNTNNTS